MLLLGKLKFLNNIYSPNRVSHSAKVNIYGQPYIREMPKITGISGSDLVIKCPVAGYPIDKIHWERGEVLHVFFFAFV
jgi:hypothetical protein